MSELDIYAKQGFAQSVGIGERPALVIVDFVLGFTDPEHFGGGNIGDGDPADGRSAGRGARAGLAHRAYHASSMRMTDRTRAPSRARRRAC